ncbi:MAG: DUF4129 domain-containing protein [Chloroflexi bacterium]|nr:DUF4129 domain-containing protein [Chloroflexota bacterium]
MRLETWDLHRLSPRRELRFALLAAMETCWVYAILAFFAARPNLRAVSPLALFVAYWLALLAGRTLPRFKRRWTILQFAAIGIGLLTLSVVVRVEIYPSAALFDFTWLPRYLSAVSNFSSGPSAEFLATLGVLYVFTRGLGFGQRPLTLWFIGFQFRLGIVAFFGLFLLAGFIGSYDAAPVIFVYFVLGLLAIALARMDEMGSNLPLAPRWAVNLLAAVALVMALGLGMLQILTLESADALVRLFAPLAAIVSGLFFLILIPLALVAGWLVELLRPLLTGLGNLGQMLNNLVPPGTEEALRQAQPDLALLNLLLPILKVLGIIAIVVGIGYLMARALNRRMEQIEEETYVREALGADEASAVLRDARVKKARARRRASIAAESIRRIYAALVARAADAGLPRRSAETPYEFLPRLEQHWPQETEQIRAITDAYVAVHYAERDLGREQVNRVREAWQEVEKRIKQ